MASRAVPWVEKYRPRVLNDVVSQDEIVDAMRHFVQTGNLPHLLFFGPAGTGKTSTGLALAQELFGPHMRSRILELNASDERGIQVIREKVKRFSQGTVAQGHVNAEGKPCPPFKLIILDEADSLTGDAQAALRRVMERHSNVTRFCLICNFVSRIIEPLTSRCAKFRFKTLPKEAAAERLESICTAEGIALPDQTTTTCTTAAAASSSSTASADPRTAVLHAAIQLSKGDLRRAITLLHSAGRLGGCIHTPLPSPAAAEGEEAEGGEEAGSGRSAAEFKPKQVILQGRRAKGKTSSAVEEELAVTPMTVDLLTELAGVVPQGIMEMLIQALNSNSFERVQAAVDAFVAEGFSALQMYDQLIDWVVASPDLSDIQKSEIAVHVAASEKALADGASEEMQLLSVLSNAAQVIARGDDVEMLLDSAPQ